MVKRTEHGWAIAGKHGLYIGWCMTRCDMIAQHVHDLRTSQDAELSRFALGGRLSVAQSQLWDKCKKNGDYTVKVTITYEPQP